jgi:hypothetical protein
LSISRHKLYFLCRLGFVHFNYLPERDRPSPQGVAPDTTDILSRKRTGWKALLGARLLHSS